MTVPLLATDVTALDAGRYERVATYLRDQGLIDAVPPITSYGVDLGAPSADGP